MLYFVFRESAEFVAFVAANERRIDPERAQPGLFPRELIVKDPKSRREDEL